MMKLRGNPFILRARRERAADDRWARTLAVMITGAALYFIIVPLFSRVYDAVACATIVWTLLLGGFAALAPSGIFAREKEVGALESVASIPMSPLPETLGRLVGAEQETIALWLAGAPLALLASCVQLWSLPVAFGLWLAAGLWAASLGTTTLLFAALGARREFVLLGTLTVFFGTIFVQENGFAMLPNLFSPFLIASSGSLPYAIATTIPVMLLWTAVATFFSTQLIGRRYPHASRGHSNGKSTRRAAQSVGLFIPFAKSNPIYVTSVRHGHGASLWKICLTVLASGLFAWWACCTLRPWCGEEEVSDYVVYLLIVCSLAAICNVAAAWSAMAGDIERDTLPLVALTGLSPESIVAGRFLCVADRLSPLWIAQMPLWGALAISCPKMAMLALWLPIAMASSTMLGLAGGFPKRKGACETSTVEGVGRIVKRVVIAMVVTVPLMQVALPLLLCTALPIMPFDMLLDHPPKGNVIGMAVSSAGVLGLQCILMIGFTYAMNRLAVGRLRSRIQPE